MADTRAAAAQGNGAAEALAAETARTTTDDSAPLATQNSAAADPSPYQAAQRIGTGDAAGGDDDDDVRTAPDSEAGNGSPAPAAPAKPPKQPFLTRMLAKIGLQPRTVMLMFKGSLPPIIAIAWYHSSAISDVYGNLGNLLPIISVLFISIMPRGKFIQQCLLNSLAICLASAFSLLAMYCGVKARQHTETLTAQQLLQIQQTRVVPYNSSQSAVSGIWLFFLAWLANMVRAHNAKFNLPCVLFSIFVNVSCTFAPMLLTVAQCESLIRQLVTAMLSSGALAAVVSLFVFPMSSRQIIMLQFAGVLGLLRKSVALQGAYLRAMERDDMYTLTNIETAVGGLGPEVKDGEKKHKWWMLCFGRGRKSSHKAPATPALTKEQKSAQALRASLGALYALVGKIQVELKFAKRDAAFGKLTADDLGEIVRLLRNISVPVNGMSTVMDMFRRTAERRGWADNANATEDELAAKDEERALWNDIMKQLHEPFNVLNETVNEGLQHVALQLEFAPRSKEQKAKVKAARLRRRAAKQNGTSGTGGENEREKDRESDPSNPASATATASDDVEASAGAPLKPGDEGFSVAVEAKVQKFIQVRDEALRSWAHKSGLIEGLPPAAKRRSGSKGLDPVVGSVDGGPQTQLYVLLYMEKLMHATIEATQDMVHFADKKVNDGTMDKTRLLFPTIRRLGKWAASAFTGRDDDGGEESAETLEHNITNIVFVGDGFGQKKDPEHLPPKNNWQRFGDYVRRFFAFLSSDESAFGLRAAVATMCIAIICFLEKTHRFFQEQRVVWALIMVAISLSQTSGQSIFGFLCRVGGTVIAMVLSFIIWYIVDGHTAGIIVFLWLSIFCCYYFFISYPRFIPASIVTIVTQVLILGYELQVKQIGIAAAEASGQLYHPVYLLAPFRLANVVVGLFVAFIWTIFPRPVTDRAWLRKDLSATLYMLANYFSVVNETLKAETTGVGGNPYVPGTPAYRLTRVRQKMFSKLMQLLPSLQSHAAWQKYEPNIGGEFPREQYDDIILRCGRILNYLALISYTVSWRPRHGPKRDEQMWKQTLGELVRAIGPTHYTILSTLSMLSNSLLSGQSLPPYMPLPRPFELTRRLLAVKKQNEEHDKSLSKRIRHKIWRNSFTSSKPVGKGMYYLRNEMDGPDSNERGEEEADRGPSLSRSRTFDPQNASRAMARRMQTHGATEKAIQRSERESMLKHGIDGEEDTERQEMEEEARRNHEAEEERRIKGGVSTKGWVDMAGPELNTTTGEAVLTRVETQRAQRLSALLDARNMEELGYTEFAVLQVCSALVCDDLEGMIQDVSSLVGVVDFSFRVDKSDTSLDSFEKGKGKTD